MCPLDDLVFFFMILIVEGLSSLLRTLDSHKWASPLQDKKNSQPRKDDCELQVLNGDMHRKAC